MKPHILLYKVLVFLAAFGFQGLSAQSDISELELNINELYGVEKLEGYHTLISHYLEKGDSRRALRYARRATELAESIIQPSNQLIAQKDRSLKTKTFLLTGEALERRGFFEESSEYYRRALNDATASGNSQLEATANGHIVRLDSIMEYAGSRKRFLGKALDDVSSVLNKGTDEVALTSALRSAEKKTDEGDHEGAIEDYNRALKIYTDRGDWESATEVRVQIADLYEELGEYKSALDELKGAREVYVRAGDSSAMKDVRAQLDSLSEYDTTEAIMPRAPSISLVPPGFGSPEYRAPQITPEELRKAENEARDIRSIAEEAERSEDYERSLNYYKAYMELERILAAERTKQELDSIEQLNLMEDYDREIRMLQQKEELIQVKLEKESLKKRNVLIGLILSSLILVSLYILYTTKRRDHSKLTVAYENLEVAQADLQTAQNRIKQLLEQQISGAVAQQLIMAKDDKSVDRKFVCVMFLDIRNFTVFTEQMRPEDIISFQNSIFSFMIDEVIQNGGIVNQILGDGFMATFGAPESNGNDTLNAFTTAKTIISKLQAKCTAGEIPPTRVGIGLHAGYVVAGNVGTDQRRQYSITGNTVITAARLEQLNKDYGSTLVISREVYDLLPKELQEPVEFKSVVVKGRSAPLEIAAYYDDPVKA